MPLDDEDDPTTAPARTHAGPEDDGIDDGPGDDDVIDMRLFASMFDKKGVIGRVRRGEKDFESHGTRAQDRMLEASRQVLEDMTRYTRVHLQGSWMRAWVFPDWWAEAGDGARTIKAAVAAGDDDARASTGASQAQGVFLRDRVVAVETSRGQWAQSMGRSIPGVAQGQPGVGKIWLLPEEALYLVERGSLDLWWPLRSLPEVLPPPVKMEAGQGQSEGKGKGADGDALPEDDEDGSAGQPEGKGKARRKEAWVEQPSPVEPDDYEAGVPLSLQAAYALLIGYDGERGKVSLAKYQVYAHLRRAGYFVLRADDAVAASSRVPRALGPPASLMQWLLSLVHSGSRPAAAQGKQWGPLLRPGFYRSYKAIYPQLSLINTEPFPTTPAPAPDSPFRIFYHVWASDGRAFSKAHPRAPDFRFAVADAQQTVAPSADEITALLGSAALLDTPAGARADAPGGRSAGRTYQRLKQGRRSVGVAVVDRGLVNFLQFGEGRFDEERLWETFDERGRTAPRGGKGGRGGGGRGRGGRGRKGGRGRGRGG